MQQALNLAKQAEANGEVPVGAILVHEDKIIGEGWNQPISSQDPTAHAEIIALRQGAKAHNNYRLPNTSLYVTLEPCAMCVGAMVHARIDRLIFAANDPKTGAVESAQALLNADFFNHQIQVTSGIMATEASEILRNFFKKRRK